MQFSSDFNVHGVQSGELLWSKKPACQGQNVSGVNPGVSILKLNYEKHWQVNKTKDHCRFIRNVCGGVIVQRCER